MGHVALVMLLPTVKAAYSSNYLNSSTMKFAWLNETLTERKHDERFKVVEVQGEFGLDINSSSLVTELFERKMMTRTGLKWPRPTSLISSANPSHLMDKKELVSFPTQLNSLPLFSSQLAFIQHLFIRIKLRYKHWTLHYFCYFNPHSNNLLIEAGCHW